ncbi:AbrB/MazE/SpoVT family DNA-binding domain-containing protein [Levilactobacillus enshiensis]|uniref:AbrB/MazE/SpoVT family DNA-binding domain-containing protein n=1 Tax=Levilactobacillus enshiensis TaxID=2590213 RepID=UPI00117AE2D0|nr:AbrB/MazE/SpoVT family DNA-binding domain-containing protein [Levilactobacillus enshiensis]
MTIVKISGKGQVVIPAEIRKELNLVAGDQLNVTLVNGQVMMARLPAAVAWQEIIAKISVEQVGVDEAGNFDMTRAPHFEHWLHGENK